MKYIFNFLVLLLLNNLKKLPLPRVIYVQIIAIVIPIPSQFLDTCAVIIVFLCILSKQERLFSHLFLYLVYMKETNPS